MSAARVIRFRIQKCIHLPRALAATVGCFAPVFDLGRARKQNKRTAETGLTKWIFYEEVHVSFGWLTRLCSPFLKIFGRTFQKILIFLVRPETAPRRGETALELRLTQPPLPNRPALSRAAYNRKGETRILRCETRSGLLVRPRGVNYVK